MRVSWRRTATANGPRRGSNPPVESFLGNDFVQTFVTPAPVEATCVGGGRVSGEVLMRVQGLVLAAIAGTAIASGCAQKRSAPDVGGPAAGALVAGGGTAGGDCRARAEGAKLVPIGTARQGSTVALATLEGRAVALVADEDAHAIVTFDAEKRVELATTPLDGAPSQLLVAKDGRVLVGLRDKGRLVALERGAEPFGPLIARCSVDVAAEPVALAATPDDATILVSSGWGHALAGLDAATLERRFAVDLPREPRAVAVSGDGKRAFVTHAVGARMSVDLGEGSHGVTAGARLLAPMVGNQPRARGAALRRRARSRADAEVEAKFLAQVIDALDAEEVLADDDARLRVRRDHARADDDHPLPGGLMEREERARRAAGRIGGEPRPRCRRCGSPASRRRRAGIFGS